MLLFTIEIMMEEQFNMDDGVSLALQQTSNSENNNKKISVF